MADARAPHPREAAWAEERHTLLRWVLKLHGEVTEGGSQVEDFGAVEVESLKASVVMKAVEKGKPIAMEKMRAKSARRRSISGSSPATTPQRTYAAAPSEPAVPVARLSSQDPDGFVHVDPAEGVLLSDARALDGEIGTPLTPRDDGPAAELPSMSLAEGSATAPPATATAGDTTSDPNVSVQSVDTVQHVPRATRSRSSSIDYGTSTNPDALAMGLHFAPCILRAPYESDVRPVRPAWRKLEATRDELLPDISYRTTQVTFAAYQYAVMATDLRPRALIDIESALTLPSVMSKGIARALALPSAELTSWLVEQRARGPPPVTLTRAKRDVLWQLECLNCSVDRVQDALECFAGSQEGVHDWRVRTLLLLLSMVEERDDVDVDVVDNTLRRGIAFLRTLQAHTAEVVGSVTADETPPALFEEWRDLAGTIRQLLGAVPSVPVGLGLELYSSLVMLSVPTRDDCDPINADDLFTTLEPLRDLWNITTSTHHLVKTELYVNFISIQGDRSAATANALSTTLQSLPPPDAMNETLWSAVVAALLGRLYKVYLVPCKTLSSAVMQPVVAAANDAVQKCPHAVFQRSLLYVVDTINHGVLPYAFPLAVPGGVVPNTRTVTPTSALAWDCALTLCSYAVWYSATMAWRQVLNAVAELNDIALDPDTLALRPQEPVDDIGLAIEVLKELTGECKQYAAVIDASGRPDVLRGVVVGCHLQLLTDLVVGVSSAAAVGVAPAPLDLARDETKLFLQHLRRWFAASGVLVDPLRPRTRAVNDADGEEPGDSPCTMLVPPLSRLSAPLAATAVEYVKAKHEDITNFVTTSAQRVQWYVPDRGAWVLPEVMDVFTCLNDNVTAIESELLFCGAYSAVTRLAKCMGGNVQAFVDELARGCSLWRGNDEFTVEDIFEMRTPRSLQEAVLALNSIGVVRSEYTKFAERFDLVWQGIARIVGDPDTIRYNNEVVLMFIEQKERAVMGYLAGLLTYTTHSTLWRQELYSIDMKHYKKYKHDAKYLKKNGADGHLKHLVPSVRGVLTELDVAMNDTLPRLVAAELRLPLVERMLRVVALLLTWIFLGESSNGEKVGRYFHEAQCIRLSQDMQAVEEFFHADGTGLAMPVIRKHFGRLKFIVQLVMARPTEELLAGGDLNLPYTSLPETDYEKPYSQEVVMAVLKHRKDQYAKKFVKKVAG